MTDFEKHGEVVRLFKALDLRGIKYRLNSDGDKIVLWPKTHRAALFDSVDAAQRFIEGYDYALTYGKEPESKV